MLLDLIQVSNYLKPNIKLSESTSKAEREKKKKKVGMRTREGRSSEILQLVKQDEDSSWKKNEEMNFKNAIFLEMRKKKYRLIKKIKKFNPEK